MSLSLLGVASVVSEGTAKLETSFHADDPDKLLIYDTLVGLPIGSVSVDLSLRMFVCKYGDETIYLTDDLDAALWILTKEVEER